MYKSIAASVGALTIAFLVYYLDSSLLPLPETLSLNSFRDYLYPVPAPLPSPTLNTVVPEVNYSANKLEYVAMSSVSRNVVEKVLSVETPEVCSNSSSILTNLTDILVLHCVLSCRAMELSFEDRSVP